MILDENLFEIKEARGSKEGVKRGPYNKEKSKSKEDIYDELQDKLEKEFYFPGVAKGGGLKVSLIMKDENKAELKGKRPARLIASSMSKYRDIKDEKELDTAKKIAKEMGFKTELDKTKKVPTLIIKLEESLNEKKSNRLTYHEFVDYLDSIDNGYTGFAKVTGNKGSGYRYTLSNKLTREQHDYLAQYDNVAFGEAQYKYAPEIKHDTIILLDRMSKTSPMKEDYDVGYDHYGPKYMAHFEGPAYIEYDGGPGNIQWLVRALNHRYYWENSTNVSKPHVFADYDSALKVQIKYGGEILPYWENTNGFENESEEISESELTLDEARTPKTKEIKVLQGNYGYGWDDLIEYELDDSTSRQDLRDYNENEPEYLHRIIFRRVQNPEYKEETVNEDIVKTSKGKWVNKGKEGTHGEFKTKKAARAQQKAMYARGFKGESLKEEYGPYKDEPYCGEIADELEEGVWIGETYNGTPWELDINGMSKDEFSPAFAEYLAHEVAYPVRDGHLKYIDLDEIIYKNSLPGEPDRFIPDLVKLGFDREDIDEWLKSPDEYEEIETWVDYDLNFSVDDWESNEELNENYTHFTYKSGANPYITKTDKETRRILNKYKGRIKKIKEGSYEIDDTRKDGSITESTNSTEDEVRAIRRDMTKLGMKPRKSTKEMTDFLTKFKAKRAEVGKENLKENIGSDIAEYQKWVDYDMKKYGRISSLTNHKIRKAGLKIVKDKYGDYEVIANEPIREDLEREFTIHYNREGFEFGGYGAVRVKATNEDKAKEKFYAEKKDDKVTISSIRPTENEDIRKGIRLLETKKVEENISMSATSPEKSKINFNVTDNGDFTFTINGKEYKGHTDKPEDMSKDLKDFGFSLTEDVEIVDQNQQEVDKKAGLENLLNDLINDENEAINGYNSAIVNFELEGKSDLTNVFRDIIKDEQNHIGNLQKVLNEINPTTIANLEQGQQEAQKTLSEDLHSNISIEDGKKLYDKYSDAMTKLGSN